MEEKEVNIPGLPKEHGFVAPDRYFDQLPTRIMQRTAYALPGGGATAPLAWYRQFKTVLAGATMVLIFVASFLATHLVSKPEFTPGATLSKISNHEIEQYLLHSVDLETADFAEFSSVLPPHRLEFIEVQSQDVSLDAAMEILDDQSESQSLEYNEF